MESQAFATERAADPLSDDAPAVFLASGRQISRATLFSLLDCGGWLAFGVVPFAWTADS